MEDFTVARVIHVLAVVLWIGGVSMVTTVIIPAIKRIKSKEEQIETFEKIEGRFALQAKITTLITAISGFYMVYSIDAWNRFLDPRFWYFHAMVIVWFLFTIVLYVLEPFVLHKLFKKYALENPKSTFNFIHKAHWVLLLLSLISIAGAVAGAHGLFLF